MLSQFFCSLLLGLLFLGSYAQDRYTPSDAFPEAENDATVLQLSTDEALDILSGGVAIDAKSRRIFRKSERWKKRAIKRLTRSEVQLQEYQDQAKRWSAEMAYALYEQTKADIQIAPITEANAYDVKLYRYFKNIEAHHEWLVTQWQQAIKPPIGERIAYTESRISGLLIIKKELLQKPEDSPSYTFQLKDINNHISSLLSYLKSVYKHTVPVAIDGQSMYHVLELAHAAYPDEIGMSEREITIDSDARDRLQFMRFMTETVKGMDDAYFRTVALAKKANTASINILEGRRSQENIEKLRALQADQKHFMQIFRTKYYSQRPPRVEYAQR